MTVQGKTCWTAGLETLETWLASAPLAFDSLKDPQAEYMSCSPLFATTYWEPLEHLPWRVPLPQDEFVDRWTAEATRRKGLDTNRIPGLKARARRAYPSLVREHHLRVLMEASGKFAATMRDMAVDMAGIDIMGVYKGVAFGIRSHHHSNRSRQYRQYKDTKPQLHLPILFDLTPDARIGLFDVHSQAQVEWMVDYLELLLSKSEAGSVFHATRIISWDEE